MALASLGSLQNSRAQTQPAPAASATTAPAAPENSAAPATPVKPPPDIFPTSPLAQVARLTQAGVDESVIMAYVTNSSSTFNLDSDRIIYLSDLGATSSLITAMMQRDQELQAQFAASQAAQPAQPAQQTAPPAEPAATDTTNLAAQPDAQPVTINYFYDTLQPYGSWIVVNGYGRCWRPTVCAYNSSWQPYCDRGRWVYSDCGWYWNSDYAWGATFHYGRWFRDASVGWCWYPDTVWAPSWVTWRYSNNYCGWAPLPPRTTCQAGVGIVYNGGSVSVGFGFGLGANCFTFVPTQHFCDPHPRNYCVAPAQVAQVYNNTTVINNYNVNNRAIVNHGIAVGSIAAAARTTIRPVPVHEINAGYAHRNYGQTVYAASANHYGYYGGSSAPARTFDTAQNHYYSQPGQNWIAQPQHNVVVATIPQRSMPIANHNPPVQIPPTQTQPANDSQQSAPLQWQQAGTPRNAPQNYYQPRQNYYHPSNPAPSQHGAPASSPATSQPQPGGNHGGNQGWPPH